MRLYTVMFDYVTAQVHERLHYKCLYLLGFNVHQQKYLPAHKLSRKSRQGKIS